MNKKTFLFYIFISLLFNNNIFAQKKILIDEVAAIVGDKIILMSDIEQNYEQAARQGIESPRLKCEVLNQLLLEKLFLNQAILDSVEVADAEVEAELDNRVRYFINMFGGDVEKLEAYYKKSIVKIKEDYRDDVKNLLLARRMQTQVVNDVTVTPSEVKAFFESIPADSLPYFNAEIELGQLVVFPKETKEQKAEIKKQLLDLKKQVEEGEDFGKLASIYSEDPGSAGNNGELGFMERGQLVSEFEGAAFKLKNGEMSNIVETQFGFHLIKMLERRGNKINVQHILMKPQVTDVERDKAQTYLDSIHNLITIDSLSFKDAVEQFSELEEGKKLGGLIISPQTGLSTFEMDQLDPNIYFTIDTLQEGQTSPAVEFTQADGKEGFRLIHVYMRSQPHLANLKDDYQKIQNQVKRNKQQEALSNWIDQKAPVTYIHIENVYQTCDLLDKWLK